jgi:glycosyltransferase involved in cell wall biosynthesis
MTEKVIEKILLVTYAAPPAAGGIQNLSYLFDSFPSSKLNVLTSYANMKFSTGPPLNGDYFFYQNPREASDESQKEAVEKRKNIFLNFDFLKTIAKIFLFVRKGIELIRKNNYDVLVAVSDFGPAMVSTYFLSRISGIPFNLILFDIYRENVPDKVHGLVARIMEPLLLKAANKIILTNEGTRDFYKNIYGNKVVEKIVVIHNSSDPELYADFIKPFDPKPPYHILFTGYFYWAQEESILNLLKSLQLLNENIFFDLYTPKKLDSETKEKLLSIYPKIHFGSAPKEEMPKVQTAADILFLPLSFGGASHRNLINTATPGKLSDYLIAGRPILINAPQSSYLARYAKENDFAAVVTEGEVINLGAEIKRLLFDKEFSENLIENARETFFQNHDMHKSKELFRSVFIKQKI